jgi:hypothetical protein
VLRVNPSVKEAVQTAFGGYRRATKKQFCSRLVAQAFSAASIQLVADSAFCTPAELQESPYLEVLAEPTVAVSAEKAQWDDVEDATQTTRNAPNVILSGARKKNGDIETFEDIHMHLARHSEDDEAFCILLDQSNYLNLWRANVERNPWQYDLALMSADPADQIAPYCLSTVADEENGPCVRAFQPISCRFQDFKSLKSLVRAQ